MRAEVKETPWSNRISKITYSQEMDNVDPEFSLGTLSITFKSKRKDKPEELQTYEYYRVPRVIWVKFYFADEEDSVGRIFEDWVKGAYKYRKI